MRPHTAHGARTTDVGGEVFSSHGVAGDGGEAAPVVAGARGMMRYSMETRNRIPDVSHCNQVTVSAQPRRLERRPQVFWSWLNTWDTLGIFVLICFGCR